MRVACNSQKADFSSLFLHLNFQSITGGPEELAGRLKRSVHSAIIDLDGATNTTENVN